MKLYLFNIFLIGTQNRLQMAGHANAIFFRGNLVFNGMFGKSYVDKNKMRDNKRIGTCQRTLKYLLSNKPNGVVYTHFKHPTVGAKMLYPPKWPIIFTITLKIDTTDR